MAEVNGVSTALAALGLARKKGAQNAHVKVLYDKYVFPAAVFSASDFIKIGSLPAGARVLDAGIRSQDLGSTGGFSLGTDDDPDGFVAALTCTTTAGDNKKSSTEALIGALFTEETDVVLDCTAATDVAAGQTIEAWVEYIVD